MILQETEDHGRCFKAPALQHVQLPLAQTLKVHIGPTFGLIIDLPHYLELSDLEAFFFDPEVRGEYQPQTIIREGELPWVRFHLDVTMMGGAGPWTLRLTDAEGLWSAEAEVIRKSGIEPLAIPLKFVTTGALQLIVKRTEGAMNKLMFIEIEDTQTEKRQRVFLSGQGTTHASGRFMHQKPGEYRWIMGGKSGRTCLLNVIAGEVTQVEIEAATSTVTFDAKALVDATADLTTNVQGAMVMVVNADDRDVGFMSELTPGPSDQPGSGTCV
ncbi:MAG: hypothetical protein ACI841_000040 [Planctomycetota bacterium]|jgi:hypothetical protein